MNISITRIPVTTLALLPAGVLRHRSHVHLILLTSLVAGCMSVVDADGEASAPVRSECVQVVIRPRRLQATVKDTEAVGAVSPNFLCLTGRWVFCGSFHLVLLVSAQAVVVNDRDGSVRVTTKAKSSTQTDNVFTCTYDKVFPDDVTQEAVYAAVKDRILAVTEGVNCTVFAYGQTGTGQW
jgi:hypothetical protein